LSETIRSNAKRKPDFRELAIRTVPTKDCHSRRVQLHDRGPARSPVLEVTQRLSVILAFPGIHDAQSQCPIQLGGRKRILVCQDLGRGSVQ